MRTSRRIPRVSVVWQEEVFPRVWRLIRLVLYLAVLGRLEPKGRIEIVVARFRSHSPVLLQHRHAIVKNLLVVRLVASEQRIKSGHRDIVELAKRRRADRRRPEFAREQANLPKVTFSSGYEYEPHGSESFAPSNGSDCNLRPTAMDLSRQDATTKKVEEPSAPARAPAPATQKPKRIRVAAGPSLSRGELLETISNIDVYRPLDTPGKKKAIRFMCDACGKGFRKRSEVVVHIRVHTGERPLKCSMCDRRFAHPSNLHAHERRHPEAKSLACTVPGCSETFADQARLRNHMLAHQQSVFACAQCSQRFKTKLRLESHVAQHH